MTAEPTSTEQPSIDQQPAEPEPAVVAAPAKPKRRHSTGVVIGAGVAGGVLGALFTAAASLVIFAFSFGPPPPPPPPGFAPAAPQFGFPPPAPPGPMAGPGMGPMWPGPHGPRPPLPGGPPPGAPGVTPPPPPAQSPASPTPPAGGQR